MATILLFIVACISCNVHPENQYSRYRQATDLEQYRKGIDALLTLIAEDGRAYVRISAAIELGEYCANKTPGSQEIMRSVAVPFLLETIRREIDSTVRGTILGTLSRIKPEPESIIPVCTKYIESSDSFEAIRAIELIKPTGYDLSVYVDLFTDKVKSNDWSERDFGISALKSMGRYAYDALPELESLWDKLKEGNLKDRVKDAIKEIQND